MSKPAYEPPSEFMFNVVLDALNFANALAKSKQDEIKELKEKHKLLEDILNSQAEVDKRTRVERQNLRMSLHRRTDQVEQLKKEVARLTAEIINIEVNNKRKIQDECPF